MKVFGRRGNDVPETLSDQEMRLQQSIDFVKTSEQIHTISNEFEAELVLTEILKSYGCILDVRRLRDTDLTVEQNEGLILRTVSEVRDLLGSTLCSPAIQAAINNFVFDAGITYGADITTVQAALEAMIAREGATAHPSLFDEDSLFADQLKHYVLSLSPADAKSLNATFMKMSDVCVLRLRYVFERLQLASSTRNEHHVAPGNKSASKTPTTQKPHSSIDAPKFCGNCGNARKVGAKFCGTCGNAFALT